MDPAVRFASLVNGPPEQLTLDQACSLMSAAFTGEYHYDQVARTLDDLAMRCEDRSLVGVLGAMRPTLRGNREHYDDPRNSYLDAVLERGLGLPITLSVVAIEVGRRLDVPIVGIGLPSHFVVRAAHHDQYGDPFDGGALYDRSGLVSNWHRLVGEVNAFDEMHLAPVTDRTILVRMLNNLRALHQRRSEARAMYALAVMRGAFEELAHEAADHARWVRFLN